MAAPLGGRGGAVAADPLEQGRAHAARREWDQGGRRLRAGPERGPTDDGHFWFEYAALLLLSGDRPGYARACAHMVERCGKAGGPRAYHVARACTLAPDAVADASLPGRLAEKELQDVRPRILVTDRARGPGVPGRPVPGGGAPSSSRACRPTPSRAVRCSTGCGWPWPISASGRPRRRGAGWARPRTWLDQYRRRDAGPCRSRSSGCTSTTGWSARPAPRGRGLDGAGNSRSGRRFQGGRHAIEVNSACQKDRVRRVGISGTRA